MTTSTHVIGVHGASGGVGASVLTSAIALRAQAAGLPAVAVDGHRLGGGLDVTMGAEQESGLRWPDLARVRGAVDGHEVVGRLPRAVDVPVLSFDRRRDVELTQDPVREVLAGLRAARRLVVIDLPTLGSPLFPCLVETCTDVVLLVGSEARGLAAACAVAPRLCDQLRVPRRPGLCVRSRGHTDELAHVVASGVGLRLCAVLRDEPGLAADLWHGLAPGSDRRGPVAGAAEELLAQLVVGTGRSVA